MSAVLPTSEDDCAGEKENTSQEVVNTIIDPLTPTPKPFCVDIKAEGLSEEEIKELHKWCLEAGGIDMESVEDWFGYKYTHFYGLCGVSETYCATHTDCFNNNLIKFSEVREFLNLPPLQQLTEPEVQPSINLTLTELQKALPKGVELTVTKGSFNVVGIHSEDYEVKSEGALIGLLGALKFVQQFEV